MTQIRQVEVVESSLDSVQKIIFWVASSKIVKYDISSDQFNCAMLHSRRVLSCQKELKLAIQKPWHVSFPSSIHLFCKQFIFIHARQCWLRAIPPAFKEIFQAILRGVLGVRVLKWLVFHSLLCVPKETVNRNMLWPRFIINGAPWSCLQRFGVRVQCTFTPCAPKTALQSTAITKEIVKCKSLAQETGVVC
jgi:hypothetical protein